MTDLIWIGNTLYPRWFVIAVAGGVVLLAVGLVAIARALLSKYSIQNRE